MLVCLYVSGMCERMFVGVGVSVPIRAWCVCERVLVGVGVSVPRRAWCVCERVFVWV